MTPDGTSHKYEPGDALPGRPAAQGFARIHGALSRSDKPGSSLLDP